MNDYLYKIRTGKDHRFENKKKQNKKEYYNDGDHRNINNDGPGGILRLISSFYPLYPFISSVNDK